MQAPNPDEGYMSRHGSQVRPSPLAPDEGYMSRHGSQVRPSPLAPDEGYMSRHGSQVRPPPLAPAECQPSGAAVGRFYQPEGQQTSSPATVQSGVVSARSLSAIT